LKRGA
jgi:hypothetical protein